MNPTELINELAQFTGTDHWYRHNLNSDITYTDGVKYFVEQAQAYWLLDIIATQPEILGTMQAGMAVIKLYVNDNSTATLICEDGNYHNTYIRLLEFTDAPVGIWTVWFTNNTILLPMEY